jgi:hypothetical protein
MNDKQKQVKENIVEIIAAGIREHKLGFELSNYEIEQVLQNVYPKTTTNRFGQPVGDYPKDIPTQAQFDQYHATPQG